MTKTLRQPSVPVPRVPCQLQGTMTADLQEPGIIPGKSRETNVPYRSQTLQEATAPRMFTTISGPTATQSHVQCDNKGVTSHWQLCITHTQVSGDMAKLTPLQAELLRRSSGSHFCVSRPTVALFTQSTELFITVQGVPWSQIPVTCGKEDKPLISLV